MPTAAPIAAACCNRWPTLDCPAPLSESSLSLPLPQFISAVSAVGMLQSALCSRHGGGRAVLRSGIWQL